MTRRSLKPWQATASIPLLIACNVFWFPAFIGKGYLAWYVDAGALVGIITALFAAAWGELDRNVLLISPVPSRYISGCFLFVSLPLISLGTQLISLGGVFDGKNGRLKPGDGWLFVDAILMIPWLIIVVALLVIWFVVIVPVQYFTFLVCGALPRSLLRSPDRILARASGAVDYETETVGQGTPATQGSWEASLADKPVTLTAALSSLLLLFLDTL